MPFFPTNHGGWQSHVAGLPGLWFSEQEGRPGVAVGCGVAVGAGVAVGVAVGEGEGEGEIVGEGPGVGVEVGEADGLGEGVSPPGDAFASGNSGLPVQTAKSRFICVLTATFVTSGAENAGTDSPPRSTATVPVGDT